MHPAVEHIEVRHRQAGSHPLRRQGLPQRDTGRGSQRPRERHRHADESVRAEPALIRSPVEVDHGLVDLGQRGPGSPAQQVGEFVVDGGDRAEHALSLVTAGIPVAPLYCLARPGRGAGRHPGASCRAVAKPERGRQRGTAARIENLQGRYLCDVEAGHFLLLSFPVPNSACRDPPAAQPGTAAGHACRQRRRARSAALRDLLAARPGERFGSGQGTGK